MLRSRFLWKLYALCAGLTTLAIAIVGLFIAHRAEQSLLRETERTLRAKAAFLKELSLEPLRGGPAAVLHARMRELGRETGVRLTVIRGDGAVLADSHEEPARMDNHADRPEILLARDHGSGAFTRFSATVGRPMMNVALAVRHEGRLLGFARCGLPLTAIHEGVAEIRTVTVLGALTALAVALVVGFLLAQRITRPLQVMTAAAEAMAAGDYGQEVRVPGGDEIAHLARAFNRMADHLRERMEIITRERNQLATILGGMAEGLIAVDAERRVVHMNEAAGRILRVAPAGSTGKPLWEVSRLPPLTQAIDQAVLQGSPDRREITVPDQPKDRAIALNSSPLRDGQGAAAGAILVLQDVTELRRLESVRRDFVANVSHELKTPLTALRGFVETILDDPAMDPATKERFLGKIRDQTGRMAAIVTDLLTLSRFELQDSIRERTSIDLRELATLSLKSIQAAAEARGIAVEAHLPDEAVPVLGEDEPLRQVLDNLLDNAVKYTPEKGRVRLTLAVREGGVLLEVEDTGIGIEPQHLDRIFERFYRVDKARSRELGGTGLGLSIVKHVVVALGGQISVRSTPGKGSLFQVRLPLAP